MRFCFARADTVYTGGDIPISEIAIKPGKLCLLDTNAGELVQEQAMVHPVKGLGYVQEAGMYVNPIVKSTMYIFQHCEELPNC